ncbi:hypothetical protein FRC19_010575 [Serendipita sp. 401]|nr:hypothetical protein FRC19_010575 [Serendipita sp. 401]KAG9053183.1 hypothetical protein FS842_008543 [Serendipita sp. 407]
MREGSHGIESDVHVSADGVVIMFHDPDLSRTTDSTGLIRDRNWFGEKGMEHCRTTKEPRQSIPTFSETIALLMRPENRHVKFNVDVKVQNDPERLFKLMHEIIAAQEDWEKTLAPRILLGLWHSNFILPAKKHLPYLTLSHIGVSLEIAREYFWESCDVFSMVFGSLATIEGERFRKDVEKAGKHIMVWTVNTEQEMMEAARWRVAAILTDKPQVWLDMRSRLSENEAVSSQYPRTFLWTSPFYYRPASLIIGYMARKRLEKAAGPLQKVSISAPPLNPTEPPVIIVATA